MKKKNNIILYGLFFLASILVETHCLLQFGNDLIVIAGVGLVVLIAAYLFMDGLLSTYAAVKEEKEQKLDEHLQTISTAIEEKLRELETLQKAIYVVTKNNTSVIGTGFKDEESSRREISGQLQEAQVKAAKMISRYNREDMKNLAAVYKQQSQELLNAWNKGMEDISGQLENMDSSGRGNGSLMDVAKITDCLNYNSDGMKLKVEGGFELMEGSLSEIRDTLVEIQSRLNHMDINVRMPETAVLEAAQETEEGSTADKGRDERISGDLVLPEEIAASVPEEAAEGIRMAVPKELAGGDMIEAAEAEEEEPKETTAAESDPNKPMSPEEIEALIASVSAEKTPVIEMPKEEETVTADNNVDIDTIDTNKQMSAEEIAKMFAAAEAGQKMPEVEIALPAENIDESRDQNKQLSPEEIAALFASIGV